MGQKLQQLVALLHPVGASRRVTPLTVVQPRRRVTALARQRRRRRRWRPRFHLPALRLPALRLPPDLPIPRLRFWINLGCSLLSVFILSGAIWLSLPRLHPRPAPPPAQSLRAMPRPVSVMTHAGDPAADD